MNFAAPLATFAALAAVCVFAFAAAAVGNALLRRTGLPVENPGERLLLAVALGAIVFELGCLLLAVCDALQVGIWTLLATGSVVAYREFGEISRLLTALRSPSRAPSRESRLLRWILAAVLLLEGIAAMAPLTGSDALHYHFAGPQWLLSGGFHSNFFSTNSFLLGQGHMLILAGLAMGSEKFALGLLFLGGLLAVLSAACLARRWMPETGAWMTALLFALTPVVFWQMSTAGTPDLWMAFFTVLAVLQTSLAIEKRAPKNAALAGIFAGAVAAGKYTGGAVAASILLALLLQSRSWRVIAPFVGGTLSSGVWPYFRNWLWTGDPVFPVLMTRLQPENVNNHAMLAFLAETGASAHRSAISLARYPVFAAIDASNLGFWQFLGPLCLCFAPLLFFAVRSTPLWRTLLLVWMVSTAAIGMTSGMLRFALPVYPLALAAVMAGVCAVPRQGWRPLREMASLTLVSFLALGFFGLLFYQRHALAAAAGLLTRDAYLSRSAPDFPKVRFVNEALRGRESEGKALVFFRHVYGLRVQPAYGNPDASWAVNPTELRSDSDWGALFQREGIRWVVKSPQYPAPIREQLERMESDGELLPVATGEVEDFVGNRMAAVRQKVPIVILQVQGMAALKAGTFRSKP